MLKQLINDPEMNDLNLHNAPILPPWLSGSKIDQPRAATYGWITREP